MADFGRPVICLRNWLSSTLAIMHLNESDVEITHLKMTSTTDMTSKQLSHRFCEALVQRLCHAIEMTDRPKVTLCLETECATEEPPPPPPSPIEGLSTTAEFK